MVEIIGIPGSLLDLKEYFEARKVPLAAVYKTGYSKNSLHILKVFLDGHKKYLHRLPKNMRALFVNASNAVTVMASLTHLPDDCFVYNSVHAGLKIDHVVLCEKGIYAISTGLMSTKQTIDRDHYAFQQLLDATANLFYRLEEPDISPDMFYRIMVMDDAVVRSSHPEVLLVQESRYICSCLEGKPVLKKRQVSSLSKRLEEMVVLVPPGEESTLSMRLRL